VPSWFVDVPKIKDKLIALNKETYWVREAPPPLSRARSPVTNSLVTSFACLCVQVPENVQTGRFHNWLTEAREW